ncbi:plc-like phosphodiesterase protein, partial [Lasius niger]
MGAHDSAFLRDASTNNSPAGNQFLNATVALDAGIRLLQAQVHKLGSALQLCHSSCGLLDAGPLEAWLAVISRWMEQNPNEVVTLLLVNADPKKATIAEYGEVFERSGIARLGYRPTIMGPTNIWPTLGDMVAQGTRVVTFLAGTEYSQSFPHLLPEFNFIFE